MPDGALKALLRADVERPRDPSLELCLLLLSGQEAKDREIPTVLAKFERKEWVMSVELYSEDIIVVSVGEGPSHFKIWLRDERSSDLAGDLQWLCGEDLDYHVIVDLARVDDFSSANYKGLLDLRELTQESDFRFVLCGLSDHLKNQLKCLHLADEFDTFATREAAIAELSTECEAFPQ